MKRIIFLLVKFFDASDHAEKFVRGQIFARRLSAFKKDEDGDESGRMDRHEGTTGWLQPENIRLTINGMDLSDDLAGPLQIQAGWLNDLNVFCLHAAHTGDLDLASLSNDNIEILRQKLTIPDECFLLGKYAVVVRNVPEFIDRMESAARAKGYRIAKGLVKYYDPATFHGNFRDVESVFQKQERCSYQREFRFVIDTGFVRRVAFRHGYWRPKGHYASTRIDRAKRRAVPRNNRAGRERRRRGGYRDESWA